MDVQASTKLQEALQKIQELENDKQKGQKLLLDKQVNDTALATLRQVTAHVIHPKGKEMITKVLEQARALIESDHNQDLAALLTGSEPLPSAASSAIDLTGDSDDNAEKPDRKPPLAVLTPSTRQAHGQPQVPSMFVGHGPPTHGSGQDTNRDRRAKRRRAEVPAEQSQSATSTDAKVPLESAQKGELKGTLITVGLEGEDHITDEAIKLDGHVRDHIKQLNTSQRRANLKHNHHELQKCIRMQYKARQIQPWSDKTGKCDWCKEHGTQCVVFVTQDRVFLMGDEV